MSPIPPAITDAINAIEAELRQIETRGGLLRDTAAKLREIYEVSPMHAAPASPAPVQFTPPLAEQVRANAPAKPARDASKGGDREAQLARVLKVAATLPQPFRMAQLHGKVSEMPRETLKDYVAQFVAVGAITKTGERAGTKYTVSPRVNPAKLEPLAAKAAPPKVATTPELADAIKRVLATGASYDLRELLKGLRGVAPTLTEAGLEPIVLQLVQDRQVLRIATESGPRFRKRAA